jgi:uncharacterized protein involved in propanediol utilization
MVSDNSASEGSRSGRGADGSGARTEHRLQVGVGRAMAHHGELLQGVFEGEDGRLHRALITLPLAAKQSMVTFWPSTQGGIRTRPEHRRKSARAAALTLEHLGIPSAGGDLTIESDIPVGHGFGSSTADVIAAIRATAAATGVTLRRSTVCRLAVEAEGASDAIAYGDQVVLFAHREGRIMEHLGGEYPPLLVVGFRSARARPIDTLSLPRARYDQEEIEQFRTLRGLAWRAVRQQDPRLIGRVATASARISQRRLANPRLEAVLDLAAAHGACGVQVAHSGTLMGVLFDADENGVATRTTALAGSLRRAGFRGIVRFAVNADGASPQ